MLARANRTNIQGPGEVDTMGTLELFDHTADVGLRLKGSSLSDLFETAARGLFGYIVANPETVVARDEQTIHLSADTSETLLVDWLNELIFRFETTHQLLSQFAVRMADDGRSLTAVVRGEPVDRQRHELDHEVKAATLHQASLAQVAGRWQAEVILDI